MLIASICVEDSIRIQRVNTWYPSKHELSKQRLTHFDATRSMLHVYLPALRLGMFSVC